MDIKTTISDALVQYNEIAPVGLTAEDHIKQAVESVRGLAIKNEHDKEGYALVKRGRLDLRQVRIAIENKGKDLRADANAYSKAVIAEQKRLVHFIEPVEVALSEQEKAFDEAKAKREADELRIKMEALQKRVATLTNLGLVLNEGYYKREHISIGVKAVEEGSDRDFAAFVDIAEKFDAEQKAIELKAMVLNHRIETLATLDYEKNVAKNQMERIVTYMPDNLQRIGIGWLETVSDDGFSATIEKIKEAQENERKRIKKEEEVLAAKAKAEQDAKDKELEELRKEKAEHEERERIELENLKFQKEVLEKSVSIDELPEMMVEGDMEVEPKAKQFDYNKAMTAKEKATELVGKYLKTIIHFQYIDKEDDNCIGTGYMTHNSAVRCALVAVDEMIVQNGEIYLCLTGEDANKYYREKNSYLFEVKEEIEKL